MKKVKPGARPAVEAEHMPETARAATGEGITRTVHRGLQMVAAMRAQKRLIALRGKVRFAIDLESLRQDR